MSLPGAVFSCKRHRVRKRLLFLGLFSAWPAQAQEIVVTGRGLDAANETAAVRVTLDRARLTSSVSNRLEDVLRDAAGFQLFRRADARSANPTSHGATLRGLGGNASSRVLVTLDGVPQADPFGGWIAWPALDPRRLGQARVTRGGGAVGGGPGALAGAIDLDSAAPDEIGGLAAHVAAGSRNSYDAALSADAALGRGSLTAFAAYARGDGFVPVVAAQRGSADRAAPYEQAGLAVRALALLSATTELQANIAAFTDRRERGTAFSAIASDGADASLRLVGRGRLPFAALLYVQTRDLATDFASVSADRASAAPVLDQYATPATGLGARVEARPLTGPLALNLGLDWRETEGRTEELFQFVAGTPTRGRIAGGRTQTFGAFAELAWQAGPLQLNGSARLDRWRIADGRLDERTLASGAILTATRFPDRGGWEPTGRIGATWRTSDSVTFRASAYRGWRLPTLNELYRPFRVGPDATAANAALSPERLSGVEAGLDWRPAPAVQIGVTAFANRLEDAIANVTLGQGPAVFPGVGFVAGAFRRRQNLGAITSRGVEIDASLSLAGWRLTASYSYADSGVRAAGLALPLDGLRPAQTPLYAASTTLAWRGATGITATLTARYAGAQYEDDLNRQRIPDALTFDAAATVPLAARLALEARVENLTDELVVSAISGAGIVERATPRTFWLGLRWGA